MYGSFGEKEAHSRCHPNSMKSCRNILGFSNNQCVCRGIIKGAGDLVHRLNQAFAEGKIKRNSRLSARRNNNLALQVFENSAWRNDV